MDLYSYIATRGCVVVSLNKTDPVLPTFRNLSNIMSYIFRQSGRFDILTECMTKTVVQIHNKYAFTVSTLAMLL